MNAKPAHEWILFKHIGVTVGSISFIPCALMPGFCLFLTNDRIAIEKHSDKKTKERCENDMIKPNVNVKLRWPCNSASFMQLENKFLFVDGEAHTQSRADVIEVVCMAKI